MTLNTYFESTSYEVVKVKGQTVFICPSEPWLPAVAPQLVAPVTRHLPLCVFFILSVYVSLLLLCQFLLYLVLLSCSWLCSSCALFSWRPAGHLVTMSACYFLRKNISSAPTCPRVCLRSRSRNRWPARTRRWKNLRFKITKWTRGPTGNPWGGVNPGVTWSVLSARARRVPDTLRQEHRAGGGDMGMTPPPLHG